MLHIPFPERLDNETFARKWAQCRFLLRKGFAFGVTWNDSEIAPEVKQEDTNQEEHGDLSD